MDLVQIALIVLLAAVAIGAVVWPILRPVRSKPAALAADPILAELLAKRETALRAVKDLEFDYQTGKVSNEDYPAYDRALKEQAVAAIQAVDDYQGRQQQATAEHRAELDAALEAEIATIRGTAAAGNGRPGGATAGSPDAVSPKFCPQCGQPTQPGGRFCANCGSALTPVGASQQGAQK